MSKFVFTRGKNLRVTFKVWGDPSHEFGGRRFPDGGTIIGPWHSSFYDYCEGFTLEAGLTAASWQKPGDFRFGENGIQHVYGRPLPDKKEFAEAWSKAVSKDKALMLRVTLGNETGALFEWNDGNKWRTSVDTRGEKPPIAGNIGSATTVKFGFNPQYIPILVDDIVIEQETTEADETLKPYLSNRPPVIKSEQTPWTHLNYNNNPDRFQFAIISDFSGQIRPELVKIMVQKLNLLQPEFVMSVGDLIEGCPVNKDFTRQQFEELDSWLAPLQMPFFYVPGNHDIANKEMREVWRERYGKDYYHFVYRNVLFICLSVNEIAWGHLSEEQINWVGKTLEENKDVRWTLVFMHDPLWEYDWPDYGTKGDWDRVESLLKGRPHTAFAGHYHFYNKQQRHDHNYYILSRTAVLPGTLYPNDTGAVDTNQIAWVTMTNEGPLLVNLPLMSILDDEAYDKEKSKEELERWRPFMRKHVEGSQGRY